MSDTPEHGTVETSYNEYDEDMLVDELAQAEMADLDPDPQDTEEPEQQEPGQETEESTDDAPEDSGQADNTKDEDLDWGDAIKEQTFTVKVNNQDIQVTGDELLKGYSRQADYTRGKQELAKRYMQVENDVRSKVIADYGEKLQLAEELVGAYVAQAPDPQLARQDPVAYAEQVEIYQQNMALRQHLEQQRQELNQQQQQHNAQQAQIRQAMVAEALFSRRPELNNQDALRGYQAEITATLSEYGYQPEETDLRTVKDPRALQLMEDAVSWRKHLAAKEKAERAGKAKRPPVMRGNARDGSKTSQTQFQRELNKASKAGDDALISMLAKMGG